MIGGQTRTPDLELVLTEASLDALPTRFPLLSAGLRLLVPLAG